MPNKYTLTASDAAEVRSVVLSECPNHYKEGGGLCIACDKKCFAINAEGAVGCHFLWFELLPNHPELFARINTQYHSGK